MIRNYWAADFETTVYEDDCRVWAWALVNIDDLDNIRYGINIGSFINELDDLTLPTIYFHNLKFDGAFIVDYLLRNGYSHVRIKKLKSKEFTTLISDTGTWYTIKINTGKRTVEFRDSLKIIPMSIEEIPKTFHLSENKLTLDYSTYREPGHPLTEQEIAYITHDVIIQAKALKEMIDNGFTRLTAGSNALNYYKNIVENYSKWFPELEPYVDRDCRLSYKGGWTYLNPKYKNKIIGRGRVYDVNSMYPWAMKYCKLPYGKPVRYEGEYKKSSIYDLYIQELECEFELKPGKYPSIQLKNSMFYSETEYIEKSVEPTTLILTSVDLELFFECYNAHNITYEGGYAFKSKMGMFTEYIDYWFNEKSKAKEEGNAGMTVIAKLMLNSLYGKFGARPDGKSKIPYLDEGSNKVKYQLSEREKRKPGYVPVATFITSYCRDKIIRSANLCGERFVYADTDSLHIIGDEEPPLDVDKYRLGAFDHESTFDRAKFIRQKTYLEMEQSIDVNGVQILKQHVKCAGMPRKVKDCVTEENFVEGQVFDGKLLPKIVPGGVILRETTFEIKKLKVKK